METHRENSPTMTRDEMKVGNIRLLRINVERSSWAGTINMEEEFSCFFRYMMGYWNA